MEEQWSPKRLHERLPLNIDRPPNLSSQYWMEEHPSPKRLHERPTLNLDLHRSPSTRRRMEEVPIVFMSPIVEKVYPLALEPQTRRNSLMPRSPLSEAPLTHRTSVQYGVLPLTPQSPAPSATFPSTPPTPSSTAPEVMTSLLQEVLGIMNGIMSHHSTVQEEDQFLRELTELVVIMQQEAEDLLALADLVEEYVEEVEVAEQVADTEDWVDDLDLGYYGFVEGEGGKECGRGHKRDDSAVGLDDDSDDFHAGELRESVYREVPIIRRQTPERKEVELVEIPRSPRIVAKDVDPMEIQRVPIISTLQLRKGKLKEPPSPFRDSGLGAPSPKSSVRCKKKSPRWI